MNSINEICVKFEDDNGEEYFCPINDVVVNRIVSEWELEECVEISTDSFL
jgi:hypothetical protein